MDVEIKTKEFEIPAIVSRQLGSQLGLEFTEEVETFYHFANSVYEEQQAIKQRHSQQITDHSVTKNLIRGELPPSEKTLLKNKLQQLTDIFIQKYIKVFFAELSAVAVKLQETGLKHHSEDSELFRMIYQSKNKLQANFIQKFSISKQRETLWIVDHTVIEDPYLTPNQNNEDIASQKKLSLIDNNKFEEWLYARIISSRLEQFYELSLSSLIYRVNDLFAQQLSPAEAAISPSSFLIYFRDNLEEFTITQNQSKQLIDVFKTAFLDKLGELYESLNSILRKIDSEEIQEEAQSSLALKVEGVDNLQKNYGVNDATDFAVTRLHRMNQQTLVA